jgi:hypothetical protein
MHLEKYFLLEREFQTVTRQIAIADASVVAQLIEHRHKLAENALAILQRFDLPAPEWCCTR